MSKAIMSPMYMPRFGAGLAHMVGISDMVGRMIQRKKHNTVRLE